MDSRPNPVPRSGTATGREGQNPRASARGASQYFRPRPQGFAAHICASPQNLGAVRSLTGTELAAYGIDADAAHSAQLVLSELVGNSVRACGEHVPLMVEVYVTSYGIAVNVHDRS